MNRTKKAWEFIKKWAAKTGRSVPETKKASWGLAMHLAKQDLPKPQ